jgi:hydroxypyruvate reductase
VTPYNPEAVLRRLFETAVAAADPMRCVPAALPPRPGGRVVVIGAGKASARIEEAVEAAWGPCEGLVITRDGYTRPCRGIEIAEASHLVPDARGIAATARLLNLLGGLGPGDTVIALISGGASALLVQPAGQITLAEKQAINAALLASGAPISEINIVRKNLSLVKGRQLATAAWPARMMSLIVSDVAGDDSALIASGPTVGDCTRPKDAADILRRWSIPVPLSVQDVLFKPRRVLLPDDPDWELLRIG